MSTPQDPRLKLRMKQAILEIMYRPYFDRRHQQLQHLVARNCVLQHDQTPSFTYRGQQYGVMQVGVRVRPKLHADLHHEMDRMVKENDQITMKERPYVDNYIALVLNTSPHAKDWLALMPDTFQAPIRALLAAYPTEATILNQSKVESILQQNQEAIQLMKQRMARNLIQC